MPVASAVERVPGVVGVDQVDRPGDRSQPFDCIVERFPAGMGVAGVEAHPDVVSGVSQPTDERLERSEASCYRGGAAGGVLDQDADREFCPVEYRQPAGDTVVVGATTGRMSAVDDEPECTDGCSCSALRLERCACRVPDCRVGARRVAQIWRMDVEEQATGAQRRFITAGFRRLPAAWRGEEHLRDVRVGAGSVSYDGVPVEMGTDLHARSPCRQRGRGAVRSRQRL